MPPGVYKHKPNQGFQKGRPGRTGEKSHLWKGGIMGLPLKERPYYKTARLQNKEYQRKIRLTVLQFYGGEIPKCNCCDEEEIKFLSIDHINGGGNKHRKSFGTKDGKGGNISHWLIRNGFPEGYQVLCHNCNMAKGFYGVCPHNML